MDYRPVIGARALRIQAKIERGYGKAAKHLGQPYAICRPNGVKDLTDLRAIMIGSRLIQFTNAKASGFSFDKGQGFDDILWAVLADQTGFCEGDYLVTDARAYFTVPSAPLVPAHAILCNRRVTHLRGNSQVDADGGSGEGLASQSVGPGTYFGVSRTPVSSAAGPGEQDLAENVPVALIALAGSARGQGDVPSDAPGPGRWRMYLPVSVFPLGTVANGDIFADDQGDRYQVATNGWTPLGYRLEMIRLEN